MKGYSLHIGVNKVDKKHYGNLQNLSAACQDAIDMQNMAVDTYGYESLGLLQDKQASSDKVLKKIKAAAKKCKSGDIFLISYSGHGSQISIPIRGRRRHEIEDQTWCLWDRQLIDDEIYNVFKTFKKGVRVLIISDSCHSGTIAKSIGEMNHSENPDTIITELGMSINDYLKANRLRSRKVTRANASSIIKKNLNLYTSIYKKTPAVDESEEINPSVLQISACQDSQVTFDGMINGVFTSYLKIALEGGKEKHFNKPEDIITQIGENYDYPTPSFLYYGSQTTFFTKGNPFLITPQEKLRIQVANKKPVAIKEVKSSRFHLDKKIIEITTDDNKKLSLDKVLKHLPKNINSISEIEDNRCLIEIEDAKDYWDNIHFINNKADILGSNIIAEPGIDTDYPIRDKFVSKQVGSEKDFMPYWPPFQNTKIDRLWHLDNEHSELAAAREEVRGLLDSGKIKGTVRIGHLDTGWDPYHPLLIHNGHIRKDLAKSFVKGEENSNPLAIDLDKKGLQNQGHGTSTLGVISGGVIKHHGVTYGQVGAAPFLEVIPIRVKDFVVVWNSDAVTKGIYYAVKQRCEVITMSMGGKPSRALAKAINYAYEKGVTIVTAAGNSFTKGLPKVGPKKLVYPAKFDRVIAACGACYNQYPYDKKQQEKHSRVRGFDMEFMQGNWGPKSAMKTAVAAYTPNIAVLTNDEENFRQSGGGTSSATPQVAATVALWLLKNKKELNDKGYSKNWLQVEAVRHALFSSAETTIPNGKKFYGNGIIKAKKTLKVKVPAISKLKKTKEAKAILNGALAVVNLLFNRRRNIDQQIGPKETASLAFELQEVIDILNDENINDALLSARTKSAYNKMYKSIIGKQKLVNNIEHSKRLRETTGI